MDYINAHVTGGGITTVYVDLPVIGDGTIGDPIDISTAIAGYGLTMTTDYIDVEAGDGIDVTEDAVAVDVDDIVGDGTQNDGSNNIAIDVSDFAGNGLQDDGSEDLEVVVADIINTDTMRDNGGDIDLATDGVDDTHIDFGTGANQVSGTDIPLNTTNFDGNLGAGDSDVLTAFETLDDISISDDQTLQEVYDEGASATLTAADGPITLLGVGGDDPTYFLQMTWNATAYHQFATNGDFVLGNIGTGDYYLQGDALAKCVSVVATEGFYLGDADSVTPIYLPDGSGNYAKLITQALSGDLTWQLPSSYAPGAGNYAIGDTDADGALEHILIPSDTDTDNYALCWDDNDPAAVGAGAAVAIVGPHCIPLSGTATYMGVYISGWVPAAGNDTITVTLWTNGGGTDTWTDNSGTAGAVGGAVSEALTQGQTVQVKAQITTVVGAPDTIEIQTATINVEVQ
jgi:hypothetical protein